MYPDAASPVSPADFRMLLFQEFVLSLLQAGPSARDSRSFLATFSPDGRLTGSKASTSNDTPVVEDILGHAARRTALVKIQGPFTEAQLGSVAKGMAYLQKLGLVSVIVVDRDDLNSGLANGLSPQDLRTIAMRDVERTVSSLIKHRAPARPILATVISSRPLDESADGTREIYVEGEGLEHIRRAVEDGEIPVIMPFALDEHCKSHHVDGNAIMKALCTAMVDAGRSIGQSSKSSNESDMTPLRLLIINREGGIPSYARSGLPHLSINLESEHDFIRRNFLPQWKDTHPTALSNLELAKDCLAIMPRASSALVVSHKSPAALIANLITNKPTFSASLPHSLLSEGKVSRHTPTLIRKGLPVTVVRDFASIDQERFTELLEKSFRRKLDRHAFYSRLEKHLDFLIVIGDYAGAALCTNEGAAASSTSKHLPFCYLDKFAVLPSHQGDGTVDFLWVALRDETFGLGLKDAANPNVGSLSGVGHGRDLVWRSRVDNPVNKWYHERSNGFITSGKWKMFWCDAEERLQGLLGVGTPITGSDVRIHFIENEEKGRLDDWEEVACTIPSAWSD